MIIFVFKMFKVLGVHYSDALSCYSTVQGAGGSGTAFTCAASTAACYVLKNTNTVFLLNLSHQRYRTLFFF